MRRWIWMLILGAGLAAGAPAEEGMVPLSELAGLDLAAAGFEIPAEVIYRPGGISLVDGIINLSGCTASFVSSQGLILTNYHCAFRAVQSLSGAETDYLEDGFSARTLAEELPAKGYTVRIIESYRDVSKEVLGAVHARMAPAERARAVEKRSKELVLQAERLHPGSRAEVAEMFAGKTYVLFQYAYLRDIRLVYAPPRAIGEFGGEEDNWMWPRHTGDFAFLRAYTGRNGETADYAPANIPFRPKRFLRVNPRGIASGDLVFLLGYPGRTYRHRSARFLKYEQTVRMPWVVSLYRWRLETLAEAAATDRTIQIKLAPRMRGYANREKNYRGKIQGMARLDLVGEREREEEALAAFIQSDPERRARYGDLLEKISELYDEIEDRAEYEFTLEYLIHGSDLLHGAFTAYEAAHERKKRESERKSAYMERNLDRTLQKLEITLSNTHLPIDRLFLKDMLLRALHLSPVMAIDPIRSLAGDRGAGTAEVDRFLHHLYERTGLRDPRAVMDLFKRSLAQLEASEDPFMQLARSLYGPFESLEEIRRRRKGTLDALSSRLLEVRQAFLGRRFVPDANGTLRLTYGRVRGYRPVDAVLFLPFTTLRGMVEKETGRFPFLLPPGLSERIRRGREGNGDGTDPSQLPVAFLYAADTTGGNSGSPVLDAGGRLVGLNFDRTFQATINDFAWNEGYSRSIGVDIRFILWWLREFSETPRLRVEMGIQGDR